MAAPESEMPEPERPDPEGPDPERPEPERSDPERPEPTAYDNAEFIPGGPGYFALWEARAAAFREGARGRLGLPCGVHPREAFDLFEPRGAPAGLFVFLHGGFWRMGDRGLWSHLAAGPVARGWAVAIPSYPLAPEVRVAQITGSIRRALPRMAEAAAGPILLAGHSAGGHLALRMLAPDAGLPAAVRARIAGVLALSPLGDLAPLIGLPMNADLRIDPAEAAAESPIRQPPPDRPVRIAVGAQERPAFLDQARRLAGAWPYATLEILPWRHHFDVIEPLEDPGSPLLRAVLAMAG